MTMKHAILSFLFILTINCNYAQSRVVLIEQFTNSSCPPCGAVSPSVYAFVNNTPRVVAIAYHTQFPYNNDSMYFENPVEATQRVNYYSVVGVPNSVLDGNVFNGSSNSFMASASSLVNNRLSVASRYDVMSSGLSLNGNLLSGVFKFTSLNNMNASENLVAQVVVIEKNVLKSSYAAAPGVNVETEYGYVMRKMIPGASGTTLINKTLNGVDSVPLNWTLANIKNKSELRVAAFVQNVVSKEVYQAGIFEIIQTPVGFMESLPDADNGRVFPNPSSGEFLLAFETVQTIRSLSILAPDGSVKFFDGAPQETRLINVKASLMPGIYLLRVETAIGTSVQKLVISN